jgi:hypothetical protein
MRDRPPAVIPDPERVKHAHADDIAREFVELIRACTVPQALFVFPDGLVEMLPELVALKWLELRPEAGNSLVGVYTPDQATIADIAQDVLEMQRESIV